MKKTNIPKIIHYCWFGGKELPELAVKCIDSWKKKSVCYMGIYSRIDSSSGLFTNYYVAYRKVVFFSIGLRFFFDNCDSGWKNYFTQNYIVNSTIFFTFKFIFYY